MQFTVSQLAAWLEVTRIVGRHFDHVSAAGVCCRGPDAVGVSSKIGLDACQYILYLLYCIILHCSFA